MNLDHDLVLILQSVYTRGLIEADEAFRFISNADISDDMAQAAAEITSQFMKSLFEQAKAEVKKVHGARS